MSTVYFHLRQDDMGFQDASIYQIAVAYIQNSLTFSNTLQIKFATYKLAKIEVENMLLSSEHV